MEILETLQLPAIAIAFASVIGFIRYVTSGIDSELNPAKRKLIATYLRANSEKSNLSWLPDFNALCDRFYGEKHVSLKCFVRSSLISVTCFICLCMIFEYSPTNSELDYVYIIMISVVNVFADYVSLFQTRVLMRSSIPTARKIAIDFYLTPFTVFSTIMLYAFLHNIMSNAINHAWDFSLGLLFNKLINEFYSGFDFIFYLTGYTTSVWLWLHALSIGCIRLVSPIKTIMSWLNVEEAPIKAIGTTINILIAVLAVFVIPIYLTVT